MNDGMEENGTESKTGIFDSGNNSGKERDGLEVNKRKISRG